MFGSTAKRVKGWPRPVALVVLVTFVSGIGLAYFFGWRLIAPVPRTIGPPTGEFSAETVSFPSDSGTMIVGWLSESPRVRGAVLLLHPVRGDRRSMIGQAAFLVAGGYTTLSIDFQAHGESPGEQITMGHLEALDAAAGVAYLRERYPGMPVAVIGRSLGGAAALLADYLKPPEAIVLEAVYANLETAIDNRFEIRFGLPGRLLTPVLALQFELFTGIDPADLDPLRAIGHWNRPVLLIYGSRDRRATLTEGRALFEAARGHKLLWTVKGAAHVNFHGYTRVEYEDRILRFLERNLRAARFIAQ